MTQQVIQDLLAKRRDRAIATILAQKERECDSYLPKEVSLRLRKTVLEQINDLYGVTLDVLSSFDNDGSIVLNELWLEKIDEVHSGMFELLSRVNGRASS